MESESKDFSATVALNNIGVDLLERGHIQQALATFKDAMKAIRGFYETSQDATGEAPITTHEMITRANQWKAQVIPSTPDLSFYQLLAHMKSNAAVCPPNARDADLMKMSIYPVRIDDVSFEAFSSDQFLDLDVRVAILVYNLGLTNLSSAYVMEDEITKIAAFKNAVRLFQMSHSILEKLCQGCDNPYALRQAATIQITVVQGLLLTLTLKGETETEGYHHRLSSLRALIKACDQNYGWMSQRIRNAPAA